VPKRARFHRGWTLAFVLRAVAALVLFTPAAACNSATGPSRLGLVGTYTLTLSASNRCRSELPEDLREQTYPGTISQSGPSLVVTVHHDRIRGWDVGRLVGVFGEPSEIMGQMGVEDWYAGAESTWYGSGPEELGYRVSGRMTGATVEEGLSGMLDGLIEASVSNDRGSQVFRCTASDHGVRFSR
jgi:hypothetical protein